MAFMERAVRLCVFLASFLTTSTAMGKGMGPENFFNNGQLKAYQHAQQDEMESLVQLVKTGIDLNQPGKEDMTMLGLAVLTADRKAIISLLQAGANPNQVIPNAGSPAIFAITQHYSPPRTKALEALFDGGYDPNQMLSAGTPYLFYFVDYNHWPGLKLAIQRGGNINVQRSSGKSLLTYIIEGGDNVQARELIAMGADVAARGQRGESALEAIESKICSAAPSIRKVWKNMLAMRELILSKLPDPKDRRSFFTDEAEEKIRRNP